MYNSEKTTPAVIEFVDIAGLVKGASKGEGLGNQFLSNIREVDAIVHVVRCFDDPNVIHVDGSVDPVRDIETINLELIFSDIEILERRIAKQSKGAFNNKDLAKEVELLKAIKAHLEDGKLARSFEVEDEDDREFINSLNLLTWKPVIFAANVAEGDLADDGASNHYVQEVREYAKANDCEVFVICAEIEQEIAELDDDEKQMFLDDLGSAPATAKGRARKVCMQHKRKCRPENRRRHFQQKQTLISFRNGLQRPSSRCDPRGRRRRRRDGCGSRCSRHAPIRRSTSAASCRGTSGCRRSAP